MTSLPLSPPVFAILSGLVEGHAGLHYGPDALELFADKVSGPAQEAGFDSLLDYYYFLRYDPAGGVALNRLVESLLVHETFFFREAESLRALVDQVIAPKLASGGRARIWCAACSTGEEPLTLAMMLSEKNLLSKTTLLASDFSQPVLDRVRQRRYSPRSIRGIPPDLASRWLDVTADGGVINADLVDAVDWRCINLFDAEAIQNVGQFDAIVCRNVLIYFSDDGALKVVKTLTSALKPGGQLLVGRSESLLRFGTQLQCEELGGSFFYTRAAA